MKRAFAALVVLACGCAEKKPAQPPRVDASAAHPAMCEVEISGTVHAPKDAPAPLTFAAVGDCLGPSPRFAGHGGTTNGRFFIEVFVPWGSDVTVCAASEPTPGAPSTLYGKAPNVMHAAKTGEVEFHDVEITLQPGPPKTFAHVAALQ